MWSKWWLLSLQNSNCLESLLFYHLLPEKQHYGYSSHYTPPKQQELLWTWPSLECILRTHDWLVGEDTILAPSPLNSLCLTPRLHMHCWPVINSQWNGPPMGQLGLLFYAAAFCLKLTDSCLWVGDPVTSSCVPYHSCSKATQDLFSKAHLACLHHSGTTALQHLVYTPCKHRLSCFCYPV